MRTRLGAMFNPPLGLAAVHRLLADALVRDCGKGALLRDDAVSGTGDTSSVSVEEPVGANLTPIARELVQAGNLSVAALAPDDKRLVVDAENGLGYFTTGVPPDGVAASYCYGFSGAIGAGTFQRVGLASVPAADQRRGGGALAAPGAAADSVWEIVDSATYGPINDVFVEHSALLQAHDEQRPYLELDGDWTITATQPGSVLTIDGLWIGGRAPRTVRLTAEAGCGWASITIARSTFDPGGADADGGTLGPITLSIESTVTELSIDSCILGPLVVAGTGLVETLTMRSSIVHTVSSATPVALSQPHGLLDIRNCTVLGRMQVHQLEASALLSTGMITVDDLQSGCIRFSAFPAGSQVPRAYRTQTIGDTRSLFTSSRFGDPGYAQLSDVAPEAIASGGEDGTEIGAFNVLLNPIKLDSLRTKVDEFLPFGLIPMFITET
jgi:hypothetical protein